VIRASRRSVMAGALAVPAAAHAARLRFARTSAPVLLHDPALQAGRRFAEAGKAAGARVLVIEGDRIRFARAVFAARPAYVQGVSRQADAVLIEDVAREFGYRHEALRASGPVLEWRLVPSFSR
jgi:hypothetical protein